MTWNSSLVFCWVLLVLFFLHSLEPAYCCVGSPIGRAHGFAARMMGGNMIRVVTLGVLVFGLISYHFYKLSHIRKRTALEIIDILYIHERETKPDYTDESGMQFYTPVKYAKRTAVMDCEELIYNKYRLWE